MGSNLIDGNPESTAIRSMLIARSNSTGATRGMLGAFLTSLSSTVHVRFDKESFIFSYTCVVNG